MSGHPRLPPSTPRLPPCTAAAAWLLASLLIGCGPTNGPAHANGGMPVSAQPPVAIPAISAAASAQASNGQTDPIDQAQLHASLATLAPQRPGIADLYVVGFAGDSSEDAFRNETRYLKQLFEQRFDARGRVIILVNHPDNLDEHPYAPLATYNNLHETLRAIGQRMDRREDILLLFVTTHGTGDHTLYVRVDAHEEDFISPRDLRDALDQADIRNRVIILSACYSGGFIPALRNPDTLILTAARADRPSFGCGNTANATYFGQAWLIDAMNRSDDPIAAFALAKAEISTRERQQGEHPSLPQLFVGRHIKDTLARWHTGLRTGPAVPYPYPAIPYPAIADSIQDH